MGTPFTLWKLPLTRPQGFPWSLTRRSQDEGPQGQIESKNSVFFRGPIDTHPRWKSPKGHRDFCTDGYSS